MLLHLLTLQLIAMHVRSELLATLSPPHHMPGPHGSGQGGLTILVCVISNILNGDLEVAWISRRSAGAQPAPFNLIRGQDGSHSAMAVISVASSEWDSYMCFVSHRGFSTVTQTQYVGFPNKTTDSEQEPDQCNEHESSTFSISQAITAQTSHLIVLALRNILLKITIFNVLMTARAVIK